MPAIPGGITKIDDQTIAITTIEQVKLPDVQDKILHLNNQISFFQDQINDAQSKILTMTTQINDLRNQFQSVGIDPTIVVNSKP